MKNIVIVESPAKAKTLGKILGRGYVLKASLGHIRDLPRSTLGVAIDNDFAPKYVVPKAKARIVNELREAVRDASTVYLATDPDREGEAIAWHLAEVIKSDGLPYKRVVFHEITEEAVKNAFQHPRDIDMQLVNAQQARRILDRLLGYKISPLLWRKVKRGLSAGRVQSVAVKIIIDREQEIQKFVPEEYWVIEAELSKPKEKPSFRATLVGLADGSPLKIGNETEANRIKGELEQANYSVLKVATKNITRPPAPPFITSTLQQEAWRKFHFTAKQTMALAQQLYEGLPIGEEGNVGLITYMRTDSTHVAQSALTETRAFISEKFGAEYLPPRPRIFTSKVQGAQEAHEAIRPTRIHREPASIKQYLNTNQFKLYDLIWKRMVASQMASALFAVTTIDVEAENKETSYLLRTSSSVNTFPGFIILYSESKDDAEEEKKVILPSLSKGDTLELIELFSEQKFTQPPPRYTEATLVRTLEQNGIGRPSTYAPILSTIQERGYVTKEKGYFKPTEIGYVVNDLLTEHFNDIVDIKFTARMEEELDDIVEAKRDWVSVVRDYYIPFQKDLDNAHQKAEKVKIPDEQTGEACPQCGKPIVIKTGRFGKFFACSGYPQCRFTRPYRVKTGVKCPECGGELIEMVNKKKKTFYGCSNYPECKFATSFKPLPQPCPKCGSLLTQYGAESARCTKCRYRGKIPQG